MSWLTAAHLRRAMIETLFQSLKAAKRLPTPPGVALRILQLVQSEDASLEELTQVISTDPALVAKILKYISSPVFGLGLEGATLPEAVGRIGMRGVQMLALSFSLISQEHRKSCPSFKFDVHWSRSLAQGVAARQLARASGAWDCDEAFVTGLVATIGQLVFATAMPAEYEPILRKPPAAGPTLEEREREKLGADHFIVGMALLKDWQLPRGVWHPVGSLSPTLAPATPGSGEQILKLASDIAEFLCEEKRQNFEMVEKLSARAQANLGIEAEDFRALLGRTGEEWMTFGSLLSMNTGQPPNLDAIEQEAEEHRTALRLAAEMEISGLRAENEQLSKIAHRDRLTGLNNRRSFDDALPLALKEAAESGRPLVLILGDIDHFKSVNDTHGHPAGDAVLRHVACVLNDQAREKEQVFRIGGEEFAIIAPNRTLEEAMTLAERMRAAVEASPCKETGKTINLSISLGLAWAQWPSRPAEAADLIDTADQRLYDAKRTGRNRCCAEAPSAAGRWNPAASAEVVKEKNSSGGGGSGFFKKLGGLFPGAKK
jgi:two-component system, cell cycle response regulator